jgi:acyl transferase domain-containing protein/NADP-dependent 3-hydroxy acid dehydrogenase YdfG
MTSYKNNPIAIVGMSCRLPGAENLYEFWKLLDEGRSDLGELPESRMNRELQYDPEMGKRTKSYTSLGGVVPQKPFDINACPISKKLLESSHPAHLTLLDVASAAFQQGNIDPKNFKNKVVGTYLGHTPPPGEVGPIMFARTISESSHCLHDVKSFDAVANGQKEEIINELVDQARSGILKDDPRLEMRANAFHAASLISEAFELDGPSMSFDAACASGFQALNFAILALQQGKLDAAVVGSASYCQADTLVLFSAAQSLSATGSRPYDENADGLIASEGYVVFVLKTLDQAIQDGDNIQAVIKSVGVSSDGKGKSLWAPRKEGQIEAVKRANDKLEDGYQNIQYIEMHATSTQVGDATEMTALTDVFSPHFPEGYKIPIGSVKANVGHTLETAGLAGLIKTVLSIQTQTVYPQINIKKLNPKIEWDQVPFFVPQQKLSWPSPAEGVPRRAAVNAFGIGGLNVHVILDEYLPITVPNTPVENNSQENSDDDGAIAIIGMGSIFPGSMTVDALWETIQSGVDQKCEVPEGRWITKKILERDPNSHWGISISKGGYIQGYEYDWKKHKVPPKQVHNADPLQFMLLDAADEALRNAGYVNKEFDGSRTGVVVGTIFGGEFSLDLQVGLRLPEFRALLHDILQKRGVSEEEVTRIADEYEDVILEKMPALIDETGSFTASSLASRITKTFNLMGGAVAVDSGDVSSLSAIEACMDILRSGSTDMMICAAGQRSMGYGNFESFAKAGILAKDHPNGPFHPESDGGLMGEGAGVLILKRLSDAVRDGDQVQAVIRGSGVSRSNALQESIQTAATRAFSSSRINPEQISLIESSSYGHPVHDNEELAALADSYSSPKLKTPVHIGSATSQFGNLGGGSGILSLIKAVKQINNTSISQNVGFEDNMPVLAPYQNTITPASKTEKIKGLNEDGKIYAGVSCYGQSKVAYHLILEGMTRVAPEDFSAITTIAANTKTEEVATSKNITKTEKQQATVSDLAGWRITRMGAANLEELQTLLADAQSNPDQIFNNSNADFTHNPFTENDQFRLAIVSENGAHLVKSCQLASKMISNPESRALLADKGIFYSESNNAVPKVALMFPGQGSQYQGMLKELIEHYPPAKEAMNEADQVLAALYLPSFTKLAWTEGDRLGKDVWLTQLSLMIADSIMCSTINSLGIPVECVTGHSFGELAAHVAAGTWSFREAIIATRKRCDSINSCEGPIGALLSTSAPENIIEELITDYADKVHISHCNSPKQTVVGGDTSDLNAFAETVKAAGYQAKLLNVPAAFHTPLMEDVKKPFRKGLQKLKMSPPRVPVLSTVNNSYVSDPNEILELLVTQMTRPINYVGVVERLIQDGINIMIEVGPRSVLTGLNRQIIEDSSIQCVSSDHQKRNGLQQLLFTRACVEVSGALDQKSHNLPIWTEHDNDLSETSEIPHHDANASSPKLKEAVDQQAEKSDYLNIVHLNGSPYERGYQHGSQLEKNIRTILKRHSDLAGTHWSKMHNLSELVSSAEEFFGAEGIEEIKGIADGAGVNYQSLIAHNIRLYLDSGYGGLFFAVTAQNSSENSMIHAVNEDLRYGLAVKDCLERFIFANHPTSQFSYLTFGVPGQVGGLNGINSEGVAVTSAVLLDAPAQGNLQPAKLQTILVKELLENSKNINDAIQTVSSKSFNGAWNLCISHHPTDSICYLEHDGNELKILSSVPMVVATNHQMNGNPAENAESHSHYRLERLKEIIGDESQPQITVPNAQKALRDQYDPKLKEVSNSSINTLRRVDNQISIIMQPSDGKMWVTPGPLANGHQNIFQELSIIDIFNKRDLNSMKNRISDIEPQVKADTDPVVVTNMALVQALDDPNNSDPNKICNRLVMRIVEQPVSTSNLQIAEQLTGHCIVIGKNEVANAFSNNLRDQGVIVEQLELNSDPDENIARFDEMWNRLQAKHLFVLTAFDPETKTSLDYNEWKTRRLAGVFIPYLLIQRWMQKLISMKTVESSSIMAGTLLGGDFGFSNQVHGAEGGALTGLIKGIKAELEMTGGQENYSARTVDFSSSMTASQIVEALNTEIIANDDEIEVAYKNNKRHVTRPMVKAVSNQEKIVFPQNGAFVITGGARGVTALVAREIGLRYGVKLHLVGSSPVPEIAESYRTFSEDELKEVKTIVMKEALANGEKPMDAWGRFEKALEIDKTLHAFEQEGLSVQYHSCDISNKSSVNLVLENIRNSGDVICGIVHGAGFERATRFEKKQRELVDRTIAAKADGAAVLMELTLNDPVQYFLAFGSVSGRFGGVGQTDYSLSNDLLAKLIDNYRSERPDVRSTVFHWHAWDDAGMAVRPESQHIRKLLDLKFMPSLEGIQHLIAEMESGVPESEVIISEISFYQKKYLPLIQNAGTSNSQPASDSNLSMSQLPLIDSFSEHQPGQRIRTDLSFNPTVDMFLIDHLFKGRPMLPVVISTEALLQSASLLLHDNESITGLNNIEIINGMRFLNDNPQQMSVIAERNQNGISASLVADFKNSKGKLLLKDKPYLKGIVQTSHSPALLTGTKPAVTEQWHESHYDKNAPIVHGPTFQCIKQMTFADETGYALIEGPSNDALETNRTGNNWITQPALLDACLFSASAITWLIRNGVVAIPHGIESVHFSRQANPGEMCLAEIKTGNIDGKHGTFDITLFGEAGDVILKVLGYKNIIIGDMVTPGELMQDQ